MSQPDFDTITVPEAVATVARSADPRCPMCHGSGCYGYTDDDEYGYEWETVCEKCCQHTMGYDQLERGPLAGRWYCCAGCGYVVDTPPSEQPGTQPQTDE